MKNLLLGLVFVFTCSLSFAGSEVSTVEGVEEVVSYRCFEKADADATRLGSEYGLSYYEEYELFNTLYDACNRKELTQAP
ncbi:MAG: hypothetical protein HRT66_12675 [Flavobacteriaceae bacterium]|nr:hypothetical protein [Flavobacteriaceae bacterium]